MAPKKKERYAGAAYDFGANAVGTTGPPPMGGPPQSSIPGLGMPAQGIPQSPQDPLAGQFGQMNLGGPPQQAQQVTPQLQQQPAAAHLNQLFPTDLVSQPFNSLELEV